MTVFDNTTMIDAVVRIARSDAQRWALFRREQASVTHHETDYAAEQALRYWVDPSRRISAIDGWAQQFILDFCSEAAAGRCAVAGYAGITKIEVPAALFTSLALVQDLLQAGKGVYTNELRLPDGTLIAAVSVSRPDQEPPKAPSELRNRPRKRGRKPEKGQQVEAQMRNELLAGDPTLEQLEDMPDKELLERYGVRHGVKSRDTVRRARDRVLAATEFIDVCRQISTNDK